jgi:hypothetical protein
MRLKAFITPILFLSTTFLYSIHNDDISNKICDHEKRIKALEKKTCYKRAHHAVRNCPQNVGFFFVGDFLYWKGRNNSWIIAMHNISEETLPTQTLIKADTLRPDFEWKPGLRVGIGYNLPHDNWDIYLDWTYVKSKAKKTVTAPNYSIEFSAFERVVYIGYIHGKWDVDYNTWDLEFGRSFYPGSYFSIRPFLGLRGTYFRQIFYTLADDPDPLTPPIDQIFPFSARVPDEYWGVGVRGGIDGELHICNYFGIFGKFSCSLLYGEVDAPIIIVDDIGIPAEETKRHITNKYYEIKPCSQIILGLSTGGCFDKKSKFFGIRAGFEMNYWWDQENSLNVGLPRDYGTPLEFAGLTLEARFEF